MRIVATIFAVLLLIFGGGCTLVWLFLSIAFSREYGALSMIEFVPLWLILGLLPLVAGILILRAQRSAGPRAMIAGSDKNESKLDEPP